MSSVSVSARLAALGPFFAAESHDPDAGSARDPWRSLGELLDDSDLRVRRVYTVRGYLAAAGRLPAESIERRVAASVMHLGLAARTLSPLFGLAALGLRLPGPGPLSLRDLRWQPSLGSMFPLSIPRLEDALSVQDGGEHSDERRDIEWLADDLFDIVNPFGVSERIAGSNVASALNGARIALSAAAPALASAAQTELDCLLARRSMNGLWRTRPDGRFQRRGCCLIYRAAPDRRGPLCGDCILVDD